MAIGQFHEGAYRIDLEDLKCFPVRVEIEPMGRTRYYLNDIPVREELGRALLEDKHNTYVVGNYGYSGVRGYSGLKAYQEYNNMNPTDERSDTMGVTTKQGGPKMSGDITCKAKVELPKPQSKCNNCGADKYELINNNWHCQYCGGQYYEKIA